MKIVVFSRLFRVLTGRVAAAQDIRSIAEPGRVYAGFGSSGQCSYVARVSLVVEGQQRSTAAGIKGCNLNGNGCPDKLLDLLLPL